MTNTNDDLKELLQGADGKIIKLILLLRAIIIPSLLVLPFVLAFVPFSHTYFWWLLPSNDPFAYVPMLPILLLIIDRMGKKYSTKYKIANKSYPSRYIGLVLILFFVFLLFLLVAGTFALITNAAQGTSTSEAIQGFQEEIQVPAYIPFKVVDSSGNVDLTHTDLSLQYTDHVHTLDVNIGTEEPSLFEDPHGTVTILANGEQAWFDSHKNNVGHSFYQLTWYHEHFKYVLSLEDDKGDFSKNEILKVANSFQPFESK